MISSSINTQSNSDYIHLQLCNMVIYSKINLQNEQKFSMAFFLQKIYCDKMKLCFYFITARCIAHNHIEQIFVQAS